VAEQYGGFNSGFGQMGSGQPAPYSPHQQHFQHQLPQEAVIMEVASGMQIQLPCTDETGQNIGTFFSNNVPYLYTVYIK